MATVHDIIYNISIHWDICAVSFVISPHNGFWFFFYNDRFLYKKSLFEINNSGHNCKHHLPKPELARQDGHLLPQQLGKD